MGLYDDLLPCIIGGECWVEHGIVEYRYKKAQPTTYRRLLDMYGHVAIASKRFTTSALIARVLGQLADEGLIGYRPTLPATGFWSYNGTVGYWSASGDTTLDGYTTWSSWAKSQGIDPEVWDLPRSEPLRLFR